MDLEAILFLFLIWLIRAVLSDDYPGKVSETADFGLDVNVW